jgi:putative tricarboxylic transport membrane protein
MRMTLQGARLATVFLAVLAVADYGRAVAADWKPDKRAVEVVVPNAPGGGNDRIVRLVIKIAQEQRLVEPVMNVVHKPGAGVVMGMNYLNQHPGDANYIGIVSATLLGDYVSGRSPIGPADVMPIAQLFTEYVAFAVKPDSGIRSAKDLLARLKADPASVSTAISGGIGNHNYIALALVGRAAGADIKKLKVVVYNSGADSNIAAMGGHVDMVISPAATVLPHVQGGKLRFLAIAAPKRLAGVFADVPVWKELGADATLSNWRTIVGPRGMTPPQIAYWENVLARVVESEEWKQMLEKSRVTGEFLRSAETRSQLKADYEELKTIMTELGLVK